MTKATSSKNGFLDATKAFGDFHVPSFDVQAIVEAQRKNFEALTQANQLAAEGLQAVAQRQVDIVQHAVKDASELIRDWAQPGAPEEVIAKNAEIAKQAFEKGVANARELNELVTKAGTDAFSGGSVRASTRCDSLRRNKSRRNSGKL
jgi:phasin family protein